MDAQQIRAAALLAASAAHSGLDPPPETLVAYAQSLTGWIAGDALPDRMTLTIGGTMPLTIDSVGAKAVLEFTDRLGDPVAPPAGTLATATSSNPAVLTVGPAQAGTDAAGNPAIEFPLTEVAAGLSVLSVHATAADGTPLLGPDAATPITDAPPVSVQVNPGAAAAERFTVPGA